MFRTLIYPSSGACDCAVELPHRSFRSRFGWMWVVSVLQATACNTDITQTQPHQTSNTRRTENETADMVIQQHSRKLLTMDILMSETCWVHKKWNKTASDIKLVFYSSTITMMHGPISIRFITVLITARHWAVYWTGWLQFHTIYSSSSLGTTTFRYIVISSLMQHPYRGHNCTMVTLKFTDCLIKGIINSTINQQMHLHNFHLKHLKPLRHVSIFSDHHQGVSSFRMLRSSIRRTPSQLNSLQQIPT